MSPPTPGRPRTTRSTHTWRSLPASSPSAGTACSSSRHRDRRSGCGTRDASCERRRPTPESLLEGTDGGEPRVIAIGEVLDVPSSSGRRARALPVDVARTVEELLSRTPLDFVHVHEPFAPSASSTALRYSRALNVGSFHAPTERLLSTTARPTLRRELLRAPRRTHREPCRDGRADEPPLPRRPIASSPTMTPPPTRSSGSTTSSPPAATTQTATPHCAVAYRDAS